MVWSMTRGKEAAAASDFPLVVVSKGKCRIYNVLRLLALHLSKTFIVLPRQRKLLQSITIRCNKSSVIKPKTQAHQLYFIRSPRRSALSPENRQAVSKTHTARQDCGGKSVDHNWPTGRLDCTANN